jgi:CubicO group peptidase (beta-lactamase class C family)
MANKGEVGLIDPVGKYLPAGVHVPERGGKAITLEDLATHSSGLPRLPTNMGFKDPANPYADYTVDQLYQFLSGYSLPRDPGTGWDYSNAGFGLLGHALALKARQDFETLVKARVLKPLGMTSTTITLNPEERARLAVGHDSKLTKVENWDLPTLAGAGALRSTANDLLTFLAANLGYTQTPLKQDLETTLSVRRPTASPGAIQALGWEVAPTRLGPIVEHDGATGGYRSLIAYDPATRVGVVILTNAETVMGADDIGLHILVGSPVGALAPPAAERPVAALSPEQLDRLVGRYQLAPGVLVTITREGPHLMSQITGQPAYEVFPSGPLEVFWKVVEAQASFTPGPDGHATGLVLHQNGRDLPAPRVP